MLYLASNASVAIHLPTVVCALLPDRKYPPTVVCALLPDRKYLPTVARMMLHVFHLLTSLSSHLQLGWSPPKPNHNPNTLQLAWSPQHGEDRLILS